MTNLLTRLRRAIIRRLIPTFGILEQKIASRDKRIQKLENAVRRISEKERWLRDQASRKSHALQRQKLAYNESMALFRSAHEHFVNGRFSQALEAAERSVAIQANNTRALAIKAEILGERGQYDEAADTADKILLTEPQNISAHKTLAAMGRSQGFRQDVAYAYAKEIRATAKHLLTTAQYFNLHSRFVLADQSASAGLASLAINPEEDRDSLYQGLALERAYALEKTGREVEALQLLDAIEGIGRTDKTQAARARCYMEMGEFSKAAEIFGLVGPEVEADRVIVDAIPTLYGLNRIGEAHRRYRIRGSSKALRRIARSKSIIENPLDAENKGKAFLFAESGPGDEIRFSTMYGEISEMAAQVTITCDPRMKTLLSRSYPPIKFIEVPRFRKELRRSASNREEIEDRGLRQFATTATLEMAASADAIGSVMDVLADLRHSRQSFLFPSRLIPDRERVEAWSGLRVKDKMMIGISWRSLLMSPARERHYFDVEDMAALAIIPDAHFVVLQAGYRSDEIEFLQRTLPSMSLHEEIDLVDDFEGQAALIENLDAVISPFTSMAELSGALGKPTILLSNSYQTTWRRNEDGTDIWHPSGYVAGANSIGDRGATITEATSLIKAMRAYPEALT